MKNKKGKRILAWIGIVFLAGLYVMTLISALLSKPYANGMFLASVFCSFMIPVLIYGFMIVGKAFGDKKEDDVSNKTGKSKDKSSNDIN